MLTSIFFAAAIQRTARFALLLLALVSLKITGCGQPTVDPALTADREIWFDKVTQPLQLSDSDLEQLARYAAAELRGDSSAVDLLPERLREDRTPRIVFLDVSTQDEFPETLMAAGEGVKAAIGRAVAIAKEMGIGPAHSQLKLDIVQKVDLLNNLDQIGIPPSDRGLYGLASTGDNRAVISPDEIMVGDLVDSKVFTLDDLLERAETQRDFPTTDETQPAGSPKSIYRFETQSVYFDGKTAIPLYRGHRRFSNVSDDEILAAATDAGKYLTQATRDDGLFVYEYYPATGHVPSDYNWVRHAGALYAMFELYGYNKDPQLLAAAERGLAKLLTLLKPGVNTDGVEQPNQLCIVNDSDATKLGGNALTVLTIAKYCEVTGKKEYVDVLEKLCNWILANQSPDGNFPMHAQAYPSGKMLSQQVVYFPGESAFALVRAYEFTGRVEYLDAAEKAAKYMIEVRDAGLADAELPNDHWLLYALHELYPHRQNELFVSHGMRIALAIIATQMNDVQHPDWRGAYILRPEANPTATRVEGLSAAFQLAKDAQQNSDADTIRQSTEDALKFLLQLQYRPESTFYFDERERALGAFRESLSKHIIRIDTVQHNISALLGVLRQRQRITAQNES